MKIVVEVPDFTEAWMAENAAEYLRGIADEIEAGATSGHLDPEHHWIAVGADERG